MYYQNQFQKLYKSNENHQPKKLDQILMQITTMNSYLTEMHNNLKFIIYRVTTIEKSLNFFILIPQKAAELNEAEKANLTNDDEMNNCTEYIIKINISESVFTN